MESLAYIGLFLFIFAIFYLVFHFIRKLKNRQKRISKLLLLIPLIGGILFFSLGVPYIDSGETQKLNDSLEANTKLQAEVKKLNSKLTELDSTNVELTSKNKDLTADNKELSSKVEDGSSAEKDLNDQKESLEKDKKKLEEKVTDLEKEIKTLKSNISDLEGDLASAKKEAASASANVSSQSSSNQTTASTTSSSSGSEYFANCTELRAVYPNGVDSSHPAYQSKMDRDKDNYACER
nr:excalibur calcium-binding domain-containing protein [Niallia taxi]